MNKLYVKVNCEMIVYQAAHRGWFFYMNNTMVTEQS